MGRASTRTPDSRLPVRDAAHVRTRVSDKFADTASSTSGRRSYREFARILEQRYVASFRMLTFILQTNGHVTKCFVLKREATPFPFAFTVLTRFTIGIFLTNERINVLRGSRKCIRLL